MAFRAGRRGFRSLRVVRNLSIFMQNGFPPVVERDTSFYPAAVRTADRAETPMRSVGIGFGG